MYGLRTGAIVASGWLAKDLSPKYIEQQTCLRSILASRHVLKNERIHAGSTHAPSRPQTYMSLTEACRQHYHLVQARCATSAADTPQDSYHGSKGGTAERRRLPAQQSRLCLTSKCLKVPGLMRTNPLLKLTHAGKTTGDMKRSPG